MDALHKDWTLEAKIMNKNAWLLLAFVGVFGAAQALGETVQGRVGAFAAQDTPWEQQWYRLMDEAERVELDLDYFIRGELGSEEVMIPAIKRNRIQVAGFSLQGLAVLAPELTVTMTPFLFDSTAEVDFVYDKFLYDTVNNLLQEQGIILVRWLEAGWFNIAANRPILTPSASQSVRIGGSPNVAVQRFLLDIGSDAVPLSLADMVQALETGMIAGMIKPTTMIFSLRGHVTDFMAANVAYDTGGLLANKTWYEGLSDRQKQVLRYGMGTDEQVRQDIRDLVAKQIEIMQADGITVHRLSLEQRQAWIRETRNTHDAIIDAAGGRAQDLYNTLLEGKAAFNSRNSD